MHARGNTAMITLHFHLQPQYNMNFICGNTVIINVRSLSNAYIAWEVELLQYLSAIRNTPCIDL